MKRLFVVVVFITSLFVFADTVQANCSVLRVQPSTGDTNTVFTILAENCSESSNYVVRINNTTNVPLSRQTGTEPIYTATLSGNQLGVVSSTQTFNLSLQENGNPTGTTGQFTVNLSTDDNDDDQNQEPPPQQGSSGTTSEKVSEGCDNENYINTGIGCIPINDVNALTKFFLGWALGIAGGIAVLMIGFASYKIATSQGDPRRLQGGQELLMSAIGGLLMIVLSVYLLRFIGVDLLGLF